MGVHSYAINLQYNSFLLDKFNSCDISPLRVKYSIHNYIVYYTHYNHSKTQQWFFYWVKKCLKKIKLPYSTDDLMLHCTAYMYHITCRLIIIA